MNLQTAFQYISNHNEEAFEKIALELFHYHSKYNPVYSSFCKALGVDNNSVNSIIQIPFLPISFFKTTTVLLSGYTPSLIFRSSGTTSRETSSHYIAYPELYKHSFLTHFKTAFGDPEQYTILALLPSYLERQDSSLVYMVNEFIRISGSPHSDFFLYDHRSLFDVLEMLKLNIKKTILIGVSFALLDFLEQYNIHFPELILMETGGMKGRRKEIIRKELHMKLQQGFGVSSVWSEYGMTELLSQAYAKSDGAFSCSPWMKVLVRDKNDPFQLLGVNQSGGLNVIDLANAYSCPFIATDDIGRLNTDNTFEVLGRLDSSNIRGCNTMIV